MGPLLATGQLDALFTESQDVGSPDVKGESSFDEVDQVYTIRGAGYNIWFERDEFQFNYRKISGDFILTGNFGFEGKGVDPHRKIGWMVRESADERAAHVSATLHGDGLTVLQWRELRGAFMRDPEDEIFPTKSHYNIMQIERKGDLFIMRAAHDGEPLQMIGSHLMDMPEEVLVGIFVCSHNPEVLETGYAWNVRMTREVASDYNAYSQGRQGSRIETMDVFSGRRKVIYESDRGIEAPNWTRDGERLLVNLDGKLFQIPVEGGDLTQINTGFADRLNNDHGISPDGVSIAISHHVNGRPGGGSTIYKMPLTGGEPVEITRLTPSYWHGWSPDGKAVLYVGQRGEDGYQIFSADVNSGLETQLTHFKMGHVDGPAYSPDGRHIYYNGSQSGTMQIWRMRPDGSDREQITFDQYNDWFPHFSPDGKWMVFISFLDDIDVNDHPFYKRVMIRMMPVDGGAPIVIAHLYGGQGTMNVPSWSPDSKRIAFVSNPGLAE